jgi:hypothetical protein
LPNIIQETFEYLIRTNSQDLAVNMFSDLNTELQSSRFNDELFSYYCSRVYNDTQIMYLNFKDFDNFEKDLFIEQSK